MRRADRLFQIIQLMRGRRVATAGWLAERLEVSERTIYRDVRDLVSSGVPIEGEAGVGYALPRDFDLPPLMFSEEEIEAVVLGARVVRAWADTELGAAATSALRKIEAVLPRRLEGTTERTAMFAPGFHIPEAAVSNLPVIRKSINRKTKLFLHYKTPDGNESRRTIRPLALFLWGHGWSLAAWCELRDDFRHFRLDRMQGLEARSETFEDDKDKDLQACMSSDK